MNPLENLAQYLDRLERRLRIFAWTRGAAAVLGLALGLTLVIVAALIWGAFSHTGVLLGRFILFVGIGGAIAVTLIAPLMRLNRRRAAQEVERRQPGFDQRLLTFTEKQRDNPTDPFLPLLADDALTLARDHQPEQIVNTKYFVRFASIGAAAAGVLLWLAFWGPGVLGYGTALLWGSLPKGQSTKAYFSLSVDPGSKTIRRRSDQTVTAHLNGFTASRASLWIEYASTPKWEEAPMISGNGAFSFPLIAVPEDVQYYVQAGGVKSETFKLHTIDLPGIKNIHVTYNYPSWTGIPASIEDPGGDLRAIEGTVAKLDITTDRPLNGAQLIIENEKPLNIPSTTGNHTTIDVPIEKDGTYHIAVTDHGESVRLTDDYFIEARKVGAPTLSITRPGRDAKVSPIEEVKVAVSSQDEFPLQELNVHYSVNGAPEKVINLLGQKGVKQAEGSTMLSFEDFKLVPGDIVSIYATAHDGKNSTKTDMYFIEAVPFEYSYSQSQQMGGGGGGGADQQEQQISEREKEIIAATFNQLKGDPKAKAAAAENGKYLADVQSKLRDQAQSLANRTKARQLDGSGAGFQQFVKEMEAAVASMTPASDKLKTLSFDAALAPEQQALQHLLRAESTFRDIQIQMSRGGGGGGGGGAGRDLANLFDLELDKDKNQFETNASSQAEQKQQEIDDTLKKLEELARRQQELAQQQQNQQSLAQQRYQQEMLRREAEELKRQMEQLQRGEQNQQAQQSQQGQQGQKGQQGQQSANGQQGSQQGSQGSQSGSQQGQNQQARSGSAGQPGSQNQQNGLNRAQSQQLDQAIKSLEQAERSMGDAASARQPGQQNQQQGQGQSQANAERAAEQLRQAGQNMAQLRQQQTGSQLGAVANKAEQLASQQQDFEQRLRRNFGQGEGNRTAAQQLADEQQKMLESYNQLQKDMLQASRDAAGADPGTSKQLRDAMGRSQEADLGTKMENTENMLRQGLGQYAVMRDAPVTRALNDLRDQLRQIEQQSAKNGAGAGGDQQQVATEQALNRAEGIRRQMEQLARTAQQRAQGNQPGNQQGNNGQKPGQGNQPGQQPGQQGQQASDQPGQGQQGQGQQGQGQQPGQGQQGQGGQQGQQAGNGAQGGGGNFGGGGGLNTSPRGGAYGPYAGTPNAPNFGDRNPGDGNGNTNGPIYQNQQDAEAAYNEMLRNLNRLRGDIADDKGLAAEYADLMRRAQEMDPRHMNNDPRLSSVINGQALAELDEVELMLRRKMEATQGSVRSTNPRNTPPGYADAVAEYYKRLSKQ